MFRISAVWIEWKNVMDKNQQSMLWKEFQSHQYRVLVLKQKGLEQLWKSAQINKKKRIARLGKFRKDRIRKIMHKWKEMYLRKKQEKEVKVKIIENSRKVGLLRMMIETFKYRFDQRISYKESNETHCEVSKQIIFCEWKR